MASSIGSGGAAISYAPNATVEEVIEKEMGQLGPGSSLTKDQKLAKISSAQRIVGQIDKELPLGKLKRDLVDLKDKVSKDIPVDSSHMAVKRCKVLFKRVIGMIRDVDDSHPLLKEVPERFLVFRNK